MTTGIVFDIKHFSLHDGPGIRTTVFFKGCPLNCGWCHNPEGIDRGKEMVFRTNRCIHCGACVTVCPEGAVHEEGDVVVTDRERCSLCGACVDACFAEAREIVGREVAVAEVMAQVERDVPFFDESGGGVTVSGGEPLLQPAFLLALLQACHRKQIHTAVDTCGYAAWETLEGIRRHVDLFLYDVKLMDDARHRRHTGVSNDSILNNLEALSRRGHRVFLRFPIVPGINDDEANIRLLGAFAGALPHLERVDLLPYHHIAVGKYDRLDKSYACNGIQSPRPESVARIAETLRTYGLQVRIGG